jgi:VIT1/CCC1 family predicted Fe2+/Mn2+ transporter
MGDANTRLLLDTASYLNSRLTVQNQEDLHSKTFLKEESIEGKRVILQDIKDSTETYNREYIEREKDSQTNPSKNTLTSIQDYSLFILFAGFAIFVITVFVYILYYSNSPVVMSIIYLVVIAIVYVLLVFLIQRYG